MIPWFIHLNSRPFGGIYRALLPIDQDLCAQIIAQDDVCLSRTLLGPLPSFKMLCELFGRSPPTRGCRRCIAEGDTGLFL